MFTQKNHNHNKKIAGKNKNNNTQKRSNRNIYENKNIAWHFRKIQIFNSFVYQQLNLIYGKIAQFQLVNKVVSRLLIFNGCKQNIRSAQESNSK